MTIKNLDAWVHRWDFRNRIRDGPLFEAASQSPSQVKETPMPAKLSVITPPGIVSFMHLDKPRPVVDGGKPRYSLTLIFDKEAQGRPEFKALKDGVDDAIKAFWPKTRPSGLKTPFRDCGEKEGQYAGYKAGDVFINPWSEFAPGITNSRKEELEMIDWSEFWSGWTARAKVTPFAYDQAGNKGASFFLEAVQFLKPGKRLDGRMPASQSFPDDVSEDEEMV